MERRSSRPPASRRRSGSYLGQQPEVINYQIYAGTSGPYNFNGLVRHYFLRSQPNQADIQVNLLSRHERNAQSHEIARRIAAGAGQDCSAASARASRWPKFLPGRRCCRPWSRKSTAPTTKGRSNSPRKIKKIFQQTPGVVDVDWYVEDPQIKYDMKVDLDKAALHGISRRGRHPHAASGTERRHRGFLHDPQSREDVPIEVRLSRPDRSGIEELGNLKLPAPSGAQISLQRSDQSSADDD